MQTRTGLAIDKVVTYASNLFWCISLEPQRCQTNHVVSAAGIFTRMHSSASMAVDLPSSSPLVHLCVFGDSELQHCEDFVIWFLVFIDGNWC